MTSEPAEWTTPIADTLLDHPELEGPDSIEEIHSAIRGRSANRPTRAGTAGRFERSLHHRLLAPVNRVHVAAIEYGYALLDGHLGATNLSLAGRPGYGDDRDQFVE